jgi:hypothetical protein
MKILVNGSSVSCGTIQTSIENSKLVEFQATWPYCIQRKTNCELTNLSLAGAGNTYIHETTVDQLSKQSYDLVLIMWADVLRHDMRVRKDKMSDFVGARATSAAQSKKNSLVKNKEKESELFQRNWIFSAQETGSDDYSSRIHNIWKGHNSYCGPREATFHSLIKIISLQSFLKATNVPYQFIFYRKPLWFSKYPELVNLVDWNNVYNNTYLYQLSRQNKWWESHHPTNTAYDVYADQLLTHLQQQHLI